jgi:hypothetical protein
MSSPFLKGLSSLQRLSITHVQSYYTRHYLPNFTARTHRLPFWTCTLIVRFLDGVRVVGQRCDFPSANQLVEFYGATAFTYAVAPEAFLRRKLLHTSRVSECCCLILPDTQGKNHNLGSYQSHANLRLLQTQKTWAFKRAFPERGIKALQVRYCNELKNRDSESDDK